MTSNAARRSNFTASRTARSATRARSRSFDGSRTCRMSCSSTARCGTHSWADTRSSRPIRWSGSACQRTAVTRCGISDFGFRIADWRIRESNPQSAIRNPQLILPPFQGGWAGMFGYELARSLEARSSSPAIDEFKIPALAVGLYDVVVAFDHLQNRAWLISQGWPEIDPFARCERATARLTEFRTHLSESRPKAAKNGSPSDEPLSVDDLAPQFAAAGHDGLTSNFSGNRLSQRSTTDDRLHPRGRCISSESLAATPPPGTRRRRSTCIVACASAIRPRSPAYLERRRLADRQRFAGAVRPRRRRPRRDAAHQGHAWPRTTPRGRPLRRRRAARERQGPGRERHDRRPVAQRSVAHLPAG